MGLTRATNAKYRGGEDGPIDFIGPIGPISPIGFRTPRRLRRSSGAFAVIAFVLALNACAAPKHKSAGYPWNESAPIADAHGQGLGIPAAGFYYHGVFPGSASGQEDDIKSADVDAYETAAGRNVAWIYFSNNWFASRAFPQATAAWIRARGATPFIRLMLRANADESHPDQPPDETFALAKILNGEFDDDLWLWGSAAASFTSPLIVEFGSEANASWFPWNGRWNGGPVRGPREFRDAYRHIVRVISAAGAANVTWAFHVNDASYPDAVWNDIGEYYPGDDAVDWLGVSDFGAKSPLDATWPLFADGMNAAIPKLAAVSPSKPIYVLEFGATSGNALGDPATWADAALTDLLAGRWASVRGFSWWNDAWSNDSIPAHNSDMRVQTVPGLSAVFKKHLVGNTSVLQAPLNAAD